MQKFEYRVISGRKKGMERKINELAEEDWILEMFFYSGENEMDGETMYTAVLKRAKV